MPYSNDKREMSIQPGCPWHTAQQTLGAPNVKWCEATQCSWISEPANTWSNLGYLIVGLVLIRKLKVSGLSGFGWAVLLMGLFSLVYHATNNFYTQFLDFVGMFLMMSYLWAFHLRRGFARLPNFGANFWALMFVNGFLFTSFMVFDQPVQLLMLLNAAPILALDLLLGAREGSLRHYGQFGLSALLLVVAQGFAIMDIQRLYCEPQNQWLHGHVLWHLLGAGGMYFAGQHLRRLQERSNSNDLQAG